MADSAPTSRPVKTEDKYLVTGKLATVEAVARLLKDDTDAAREVLLTLGLIEPVKASPAPVLKARTSTQKTTLQIRFTWQFLPRGRRMHAVRSASRRTVCGARLAPREDWRTPSERELADDRKCIACQDRNYVRRAA